MQGRPLITRRSANDNGIHDHRPGQKGGGLGIDIEAGAVVVCAILCALIVMPVSWLLYYAFTDKARRFHAR